MPGSFGLVILGLAIAACGQPALSADGGTSGEADARTTADAGDAVDSGSPADAAPADAPTPTGPHVVSVTPADGATGVARKSDVRVTFSEAMNAETITRDSLQLRIDGAPVSTWVTYDARTSTAILRPSWPMPRTSRVEVTLRGSVANPAGMGIGDDLRWAFRVRDSRWSDPVELGYANGDLDRAVVRMNAAGNAVVVWNGREEIHAARFEGGVWHRDYAISPRLFWRSGGWQVGIGPGGHAVATYLNRNAGTWELNSVTHPSTTGRWTAPRLVATAVTRKDSGRAFLDVAVDGAGNALATWAAEYGGGYAQGSNRLVSGTWGTPVSLGTGLGPHLGIDARGTVVGLWQPAFSSGIVAGQTAVTGGEWTTATLGTGDEAELAVNARGQGIAVWSFGEHSTYYIRARLRAADGTWGEPHDVDVWGEFLRWPHVAIDADGNAIVAWSRQQHTAGHRPFVARYTAAGGWEAPRELASDRDATASDVVSAASGDALALWTTNPTETRIKRFSVATGWEAEDELPFTGGYDDVAMAPNGTAILVRTQACFTTATPCIVATVFQP